MDLGGQGTGPCHTHAQSVVDNNEVPCCQQPRKGIDAFSLRRGSGDFDSLGYDKDEGEETDE